MIGGEIIYLDPAAFNARDLIKDVLDRNLDQLSSIVTLWLPFLIMKTYTERL